MRPFIWIICPILLFACILSCQKVPDVTLDEPFGNLQVPDSIVFSYQPIKDSLPIPAGLDYEFTLDPAGTAWLTVSQLVESNGVKYVILELEENLTDSSRFVRLTIRQKNGSSPQAKTIKIIQEPDRTPFLKTDSTSITLGNPEGSVDSFQIQSNVNWTISLPATTSWLTINKTSGNGNTKIILTTNRSNSFSNVQTANLVITPDGLQPVTLTVRQKTNTVASKWMHASAGHPWQFNAVSTTDEGGYITVGSAVRTPTAVISEVLVEKRDALGNYLWGKYLGQGTPASASSVITIPGGGYLLAGYSNSTTSRANMWVIKLDASGNVNWQKTFGGSGDDFALGLTRTTDGGYVICGESNSTDGDITTPRGLKDAWILKIDANGNKLWQKSLGGSMDDKATGITASDAGSVVIAVTTASNDQDITNYLGGSTDGWIIKLDASGNPVWKQNVGGTSQDEANAISSTKDGGYIIGGSTASLINGSRGNLDMMIVKLDRDGKKQWERALGGPGNDKGFAVIQAADGNYLIAGETEQSGGDIGRSVLGATDGWIAKLSEKTNIIWERNVWSISDERIHGIAQLKDGIIVAGYEVRPYAAPGASRQQASWVAYMVE